MTAAAKHIKEQFILVTKVLQVVFIILFWASVECAHCVHVNVNIIENVLIFEYIPIYVHVPGAARINWKAPNTKYMKTMTSGGFVLSYIMPYWSLSPFAWQVNEIGLEFQLALAIQCLYYVVIDSCPCHRPFTQNRIHTTRTILTWLCQ